MERLHNYFKGLLYKYKIDFNSPMINFTVPKTLLKFTKLTFDLKFTR